MAVIKIKSTAATGSVSSALTTAPALVLGELAFSFGNQVLALGSGVVGSATGNSLDSISGRINRIVGGSAFFDQTAATFGKTGTGDNVLATGPSISGPTLSGTVSITGATTFTNTVTVGADTTPIATTLYGTLTVGSNTNQRATTLYGNLTVGVAGGTVEVTTLNGTLSVTGASDFNDAVTFTYANGISFRDLNNTPNPAYTIKTNSGTTDTLSTLFLPYTGTSTESENTLATVGGIAQTFGANKTWNGAAIAATYGGTGLTSSSYTLGDILFVNVANPTSLSRLPVQPAGYILGGGTIPTWTTTPQVSTLFLAASSNQLVFNTGAVAGTLSWAPATTTKTITLPNLDGTVMLTSGTQTIETGVTWNGNAIGVAYGGTGVATLASNGVLYGNGTGAVQVTGTTVTNSVLTGNGTIPSFQTNVTIGRLTLTDITAAGAAATLTVSPGPRTAVSAESSAFIVNTNQITLTGAITGSQRFTVFKAGNITAASALNVATAVTVAITGAPAFSTATFTNKYALLVEADDVLFKGLIKAGSTPTTLTDSFGKIVTGALNTVGVGQGGTGQTTFTTNGVLYGNAATSILVTAAGTSAQVLTANASGIPTWGTVALGNASAVSGILSPNNGGTGLNNAGTIGAAANVAFSGTSAYTTTFALPTAASITLTLPTTTSTLATVGLAETLTNKTLTTPTIATINGVTAINGVNNTNLVITSSGTGITQFSSGVPVVFSSGATFDGANPTVNTPYTGTNLTSNHLVTRGYVDALAQGLHMHAPADVILTTGNISSDSSSNGVTGVRTTTYAGNTITIQATSGYLTMTVDQEAITLWTRIIINLTDASQQIYNGIYSKAMTPSNGVNVTLITLTRADDADVLADINGGDFILVQNGYTFKECGFVQSVSPVVGSSDILSNTNGTFKPVFVQFSQAGVIEAGAGLTKTGIRVDVVGSSSINVLADYIEVSTGYTGGANIATVGTVTSGTIDGGTF